MTKKNVSVSVLFLYFESCLCKMFIYSILPYIKITFTRFSAQDKSETLSSKYVSPRRDPTKIMKSLLNKHFRGIVFI